LQDDGVVDASGTGADLPATLSQTYDQPGTYVAVAAVTDGESTTTTTTTVTVAPAP
jgi:hypothetical protein